MRRRATDRPVPRRASRRGASRLHGVGSMSGEASALVPAGAANGLLSSPSARGVFDRTWPHVPVPLADEELVHRVLRWPISQHRTADFLTSFTRGVKSMNFPSPDRAALGVNIGIPSRNSNIYTIHMPNSVKGASVMSYVYQGEWRAQCKCRMSRHRATSSSR